MSKRKMRRLRCLRTLLLMGAYVDMPELYDRLYWLDPLIKDAL